MVDTILSPNAKGVVAPIVRPTWVPTGAALRLSVSPVVLAVTATPVFGAEMLPGGTAAEIIDGAPAPGFCWPTTIPSMLASTFSPTGNGSMTTPVPKAAPVTWIPPAMPTPAGAVTCSPKELTGMLLMVTTGVVLVVATPLNVMVFAAGESVNGSATSNRSAVDAFSEAYSAAVKVVPVTSKSPVTI